MRSPTAFRSGTHRAAASSTPAVPAAPAAPATVAGQPATEPAGTAAVPAAAAAAEPGARRRWPSVSPMQRIVALTSTMGAAAVVLYLTVVRQLPVTAAPVHLPWLLWVAGFVVAETLVVHVQWNHDSHSFSAGDLVLAAGLMLTSPGQLIAAQVLGVGVTLVYPRRQRPVKLFFNVASYALTAVLATCVYGGFAVWAGSTWAWLGSLLGVAVSTAVTTVCVFAVMVLSDGRQPQVQLRGMLRQSVPYTAASAAIGAAIARSVEHDPVAILLLALPAALTVTAYRALSRSRAQQENMRLLHDVTSLLHTGGDSHEALGDFLTAVRKAFKAGTAELLLLGAEDSVSRSQDGAASVVMAPLADATAHAPLLELTAPARALRTRSAARRRGPIDAYADGRGLQDAMVAVLRTEERVHGLLVVADRLGEATTFSASDLELLETFARHVATSLERGRLEKTLREVTDLKEQLRHQALHDPLTGLPNRTLFLDRARQAVHLAARSGQWPAILFIDLDGFKPVNDTFGHESGDLLLRTVASRIRSCLRPSDSAARLGGDEFAILLNGPVDREAATGVLERLREQLEVPVQLGDGRIAQIGMSVGAALGCPDLADADALIRQADMAMYAAKRGGGHSYLFYEPGLGDRGDARQDAVAELSEAIRDGQLFVTYQPLVDARTGRPVGAEALVRWQHPDGLRTPDAFIGVAEDSGLITEIGSLVLRDACQQAARWAQACPDDDLLVTVNLSGRQLADPGIVGEVAAALTDSGLLPHRLVLEITETVLMQDRDAAARTLWALKALGVRIAIDDFGTGYSSLAYLRRFPLDMLKVAREFVDGLGHDAHDDVITRAIVELARALDLQTIAEGIETPEQLQHLNALGIDLGQGYLFARPIDADAVLALITGRPAADD